jgi:hypothetical protein
MTGMRRAVIKSAGRALAGWLSACFLVAAAAASGAAPPAPELRPWEWIGEWIGE